eukprot:1048243-Prorocentrum_minimum.AAC.1
MEFMYGSGFFWVSFSPIPILALGYLGFTCIPLDPSTPRVSFRFYKVKTLRPELPEIGGASEIYLLDVRCP